MYYDWGQEETRGVIHHLGMLLCSLMEGSHSRLEEPPRDKDRGDMPGGGITTRG